MTNEIVKHTGGIQRAEAPRMSLIETMTFCDQLLKSGIFAKQFASKEAIFVAYQWTVDMNLKSIPTMMCMSMVHGRLCVESKVYRALFTDNGGDMEILKWTKDGCKLLFTKPGRKPMEYEFTMEDAKLEGLTGKDNWKKMPKLMILERGSGRGIKAFDPASTLGLYTREEMEDVDKPFDTTPQKNYTETPPNVDEMPNGLKTEEEIADAEIVEEDNGFSQQEEDVNPATASSPEEATEITEVVEKIKTALDAEFGLSTKKATATEITAFKKWLYGYQDTVGTHGKKYVGKNAFGHASFGAGKLEDLRILLKEIRNAVSTYNKEK